MVGWDWYVDYGSHTEWMHSSCMEPIYLVTCIWRAPAMTYSASDDCQHHGITLMVTTTVIMCMVTVIHEVCRFKINSTLLIALFSVHLTKAPKPKRAHCFKDIIGYIIGSIISILSMKVFSLSTSTGSLSSRSVCATLSNNDIRLLLACREL